MTLTLKNTSNLLSSCPSHSRSTPKDLPKNQSTTSIKEIFTGFVESLKYCPEDPISEDNATYQSLRSEFSAYDDGNKLFDESCRGAATMAELPYPGHTPEVRLQIARFTWCLIYIDDLGQKFPSSLGGFQQRILENDYPQGDILQTFREHLTDIYRFWDPIPGNGITLAAMDFINGCLLEQMPAIRDMKLSDAGRSWPYFLRNKTGCSAAYAFMLFPKHLNLDLSIYIQAIEDIILFTSLGNDVLSFHKEYLAGETNNYVSNRAHVTQRSITDALQDVADDTLAAHARVTKLLQNTGAALPWKRYVNGSVAFHFTLKRYRLDELGF